jgi:hypothetical protein
METMKTNGTGTRVWDFSKRFLEHRYLPAILAIGAILVMLPALKTGLPVSPVYPLRSAAIIDQIAWKR